MSFNFESERDIKRVVKQTLHSERALRDSGDLAEFASSINQKWVPFRNDSGQQVPPYGCVAITDLSIGAGSEYPVHVVERPGTTFRRECGLNGPEAVAAGEFGMMCISGMAIGAYGTGTPASGEGWGPKPGQFTLAKGYPGGATVTGVLDSSNLWLVGATAPVTTLLCKATATLSVGSTSSNYQIWSGSAGAGANSGYTVLPSIDVRSSITSGDFFLAHWVDSGWVTTASAEGLKFYYAPLPSELLEGDSSKAIPLGLVDYDTGDATGAVTVDNLFRLRGLFADFMLVMEAPESPNGYVIVQIEQRNVRWFRAKLNGYLTADDSTANVDSIYPIDGFAAPSPAITVATNIFSLYGRDNADCLLVIDYTTLDEDDEPLYLLVQVDNPGLLFRATLGAALLSASGTATISNVEGLDGSASPGFTTAVNIFNLSGDIYSNCLVALDFKTTQEDGTPKALLVQVDHLPVTFVTALRMSDDSIEYKTQKVTVMYEEEESDWITLPGEEDPPVVNVTVVSDIDYTARALTYKTRTIKVKSTGAESAPITVHTMVLQSWVDNITFSGTTISWTETGGYVWETEEGASGWASITGSEVPYVTNVFTSGTNIYQQKALATVFSNFPIGNYLVNAGTTCDDEVAIPEALPAAATLAEAGGLSTFIYYFGA